MQNRKNDIDFINKLKLVYDTHELVNRETLNKYVLNNVSFKIKVASTKDNMTVVVCDKMINELESNGITFDKVTMNELTSMKLYGPNDYVLLNDLLRDAKGSIVTYIEVINKSKKHQMENEMIDEIKAYGVKAMVTSIHDDVIKYFKKKAPSIIRGLKYQSLEDEDLKLGFFEKQKIKNVSFSNSLDLDFIEYDIRCIPNENISRVKENNIAIVAELIDTDAKANKAAFYANAQVIKKDMLV